MAGLPKGTVRNNIVLPPNYGKKVTVGGQRTTLKPQLEVSVYKDRYGRYTVVEKGHRLTAEEKKLGLKRTRSKEALFIKQQFEMSGPRTTMRKLDSKRMQSNRRFRTWEVNGVKGWQDMDSWAFIGKDMPGRKGEVESLMYSLDRTTAGAAEGYDFLGTWRRMNTDEKFEAMQLLYEIDWENFFIEFIDSDGKMTRYVDETRQQEGLDMVMGILASVKG